MPKSRTTAALHPSMWTLLALFWVGCPGESSRGPADGGGSTSVDGGGGGAQTVQLGCSADAECGSGKICALSTGECVEGTDCTQNPGICSFCDDETTGCGFIAAAYCDEGAGVCRRTKGTCEACTVDAECGTAASGLPNRCLDQFCAEGCGGCPPGFSCQSGGCVPVAEAGQCATAIRCDGGGTCPDGQTCSELGICLSICGADSDCPAGRICSLDPGPLRGLCIQGCTFGETINDGALICHANGRYGAPCSTPDSTVGCPAGTTCEASGACGLTGCQTDSDCPVVRTYCDTASGECIEGCNDPSDCGAFELCEDNRCVKEGCRGKDVSCNLGEWCCGHDAFSDPSTCPAPVEEGQCFVTPEPWCRTCESSTDCADIQVLGYVSSCLELTREDEQGNSQSLGKYCTVGCNTNADCPRGIQCLADLPTDQQGVTTNGCIDVMCQPISAGRMTP